MSGMSYVSSYFHCVFSTKERHPSIPPTHETFPEHRLFRWQVKYGAFGVSVSLLDKTIQYIENQEKHHRNTTFQEEFLVLLKKHQIAYDELYLWE